MSNSLNSGHRTPTDVYADLHGVRYSLTHLDADERHLIEELSRFARDHCESSAFRNHFMGVVGDFYLKRGLSRREIAQTVVWRIAQDIGSRLMVAEGSARAPSLREELVDLIESQFSSRREFCQATGLSEDMLSHVLAGRKNLSIGALTDALAKVGYTIHITQLPEVQQS